MEILEQLSKTKNLESKKILLIEICRQYSYLINFRNILEIVAIQRRDNLMWAIPGGMVDAGEKSTKALKREFIEEAMNSNTGMVDF